MNYIPAESEFRQAYEELKEEARSDFWFRVKVRTVIFAPIVIILLTGAVTLGYLGV